MNVKTNKHFTLIFKPLKFSSYLFVNISHKYTSVNNNNRKGRYIGLVYLFITSTWYMI